MAQSKPCFGPMESSPKPGIGDNYDRFCENCSFVIEKMALDKFTGMKCRNCKHEVEFLDKSDGIYRRCVRCCAFLRCTSKYCNICGRPNQFYDPKKPSRLERMKEMQMEERIRRDILEETALSQSFSNDNFETDDKTVETPDDKKQPIATQSSSGQTDMTE